MSHLPPRQGSGKAKMIRKRRENINEMTRNTMVTGSAGTPWSRAQLDVLLASGHKTELWASWELLVFSFLHWLLLSQELGSVWMQVLPAKVSVAGLNGLRGDPSALTSTLDMRLGARNTYKDRDTLPSCWLAKEGHGAWVPPEVSNVVLDPL